MQSPRNSLAGLVDAVPWQANSRDPLRGPDIPSRK
jgi:hypothetical protein